MKEVFGTTNEMVMFDLFGRFVYKFELDYKWERYFWYSTEYFNISCTYIKCIHECSDSMLNGIFRISNYENRCI